MRDGEPGESSLLTFDTHILTLRYQLLHNEDNKLGITVTNRKGDEFVC